MLREEPALRSLDLGLQGQGDQPAGRRGLTTMVSAPMTMSGARRSFCKRPGPSFSQEGPGCAASTLLSQRTSRQASPGIQQTQSERETWRPSASPVTPGRSSDMWVPTPTLAALNHASLHGPKSATRVHLLTPTNNS